MPTVHLRIRGKVQGVFYRATAQEVAEELGLTGWIRNTEEGDVEAKASGNNEQLEQFIQWCRKGPKKALVTEVMVTGIPDEAFDAFRVKRG